ncbi:hypothetical protein SERLA73DRAFT_75783 [Serpula lacrymans var. lacrymans S7.3]|uniref:Uncharacterized protein n=2 Tax=Serpula lacrymans var. lacrymans TaxID=341189 RepID=F8Q482_SERL3|nr:uncharacterized protein SERLADRAFT_440550 [Serpula lacrymans var. lacrymans S7.9]EGN96938.1 hypothetical protein SERLA73DRAFT_75783 [Serpula lacrymans var. lacrymans S7.3]EGO22530.1 hypothetical protein SERLADRAFT_440550 [Serpula lacrymans var. lacrymans S7.9]
MSTDRISFQAHLSDERSSMAYYCSHYRLPNARTHHDELIALPAHQAPRLSRRGAAFTILKFNQNSSIQAPDKIMAKLEHSRPFPLIPFADDPAYNPLMRISYHLGCMVLDRLVA